MEDEIFKMAGRQIGFRLTEANIETLYETIIDRVNLYSELYGIEQTIKIIDLMYKKVETDKKLEIKNINNIKLDKNLLNIKETKDNFSFKLLPLTMDISLYGRPLLKEEKDNITKLNISYNNEDKIFYYEPLKNKKTLIIVVNNKNKISNISIYDAIKGYLICFVKDTKISCNSFTRTINNVTFYIEFNKITKIEITRKLDAIKYTNKPVYDRNKNIGSFDLETYQDNDGFWKVYALGYYTTIDIKPTLFYLTDINKEYDSEELVLNCIDQMLVNKYNNFTFYTHNFGRYDFIFIYNILLKANDKKGFEYYKLKINTREDTILKLTITLKKNTKNIQIHFVDSLNLLNFSLDKLAKDFYITMEKGYFPYLFVKRETLLYEGLTPDIKFYPKLNQKNAKDLVIYKNLYKNNWKLREETLFYLEKDLTILFDIVMEFSSKLYEDFNINLTDATTISRLAINIYSKKYLKEQIPSITNQSLFKFIKSAYFGGITEVYKPYGENLKLIDVNSLYPFTALNPMPGTNSVYMETFDKSLELNDLFGFFYAKVQTPSDCYYGLLPIRSPNGVIYPKGTFYNVWSSEELKLAKENGYSITVIKGFNFDKQTSPFTNYINDFYKRKNISEGSRRTIYKSLLNNLLGRFGLDFNKPITEQVDFAKRDYLASTRIIKSQFELFNNKVLITYLPTISRDICEEHGLDYFKVLEEENKDLTSLEIKTFKDTSIACSAMINSYARIFMNKIKLYLFKNNVNIYYMDTDSFVLDDNGFELLKNINLIGNNLGQFKLEYNIEKAYIISNKTYCLVLNEKNNEFVIKAKGVNKSSLNINNFIDLYNNKNVNTIKQNTSIDYQNASVEIFNTNVLLNHDSYTKRNKIYNSKGIWIDTEPIDFTNDK